MTLAGLVLLGLGGVYAWHLTSFARGFRRAARHSDLRPPADPPPPLSVVVPARNEEAAIGACLDGLLAQDYPGPFEVIVVDDDSADATPDLVRARMARDDRLRLVQVPENRHRARAHKKAAVAKAVGAAAGDIVLQTDADCHAPPGWARAMAGAFDTDDVAFVSGPVAYRLGPRAGLFRRLQAMDFFGVMACGAGGIGLGRPNLANGASVGYRRDVFLALGGFDGIDHVTSGDDELLMQKIAYRTGHAVRFCADPAALVLTDPVATPQAWLSQRRRWASKTASYPARLKGVIAGLGAFLAALSVALPALLVVPLFWPWVAAALGVKAAADLSVLVPAARRFGQARVLWALPAHLLVHAPLSVVVGVLGPFGRFEWKGRSLDR